MQSITTQQIKEHRAQRKASGLVGCIDGSDGPSMSLKGISWRPEDPKNPHCFCHDCRTTWDPEGDIDLELINEGNQRACYVYASLIPSKKNVLRELMAHADDALEDFVKAQMDLVGKMAIAKSYQEEYDGLSRSYRGMTGNQSYTFLKQNEQESDLMEMKLSKLRHAIRDSKGGTDTAEIKCCEMETILSKARKTMREFLDTNF